MQILKKVWFISLAALASLEQASAISFGQDKVSSSVSWGTQTETLDVSAQRMISNAMAFLGVLAVCYGIYGGFLIVTAGWEEEKVKKGKTILIQVTIGLVVIFLANSIIQLVLQKFFATTP